MNTSISFNLDNRLDQMRAQRYELRILEPTIELMEEIPTDLEEEIYPELYGKLRSLLGPDLIKDYEARGFLADNGRHYIRVYYRGWGQGVSNNIDLDTAMKDAVSQLKEDLKDRRHDLDKTVARIDANYKWQD